MKNINFGIDLGTTNSAIAKYENGKVIIYKNPVGFKDTIPSVVSFRKGRIQIGDKAREHSISNAENVFSSFKRKMGSDENYFVKDIDKNVSPIELSAMVLKELINFTQNENPKTAVITIPASFDTIQTNATKKSGYEAGFKEVVLLQEPIAACLAYSNTQNLDIEVEKKWLVYDFGGGTFDVALVKIDERELKVIDHKGNNFLGGVDLDTLFVEKILCPKIEAQSSERNLWSKMVLGEEILYKKLYFELLFKAEEAKKELSLKEFTSIEIESDELDFSIDLEVSKLEFEQIVKPKFEESFQLTEKLIAENGLLFSDIDRIILVGGTTYIPFIRKELLNKTQITIDSSIDPTTAVVLGASFYAGSKPTELIEEELKNEVLQIKDKVEVELIFETNSKDSEELIVAVLNSQFEGFYRITRADGGFDTGVLKINKKIAEFVPLLEKATNVFSLFLYDNLQNQVYLNNTIQITNGIYNISGQPLPNDICLEIDEEAGKTFMERIFKKNDILPLKKTIYKTVSKTILKNSTEKLIINIVEGNAGSMVGSNLTIGYIEISGENFQHDLLKGMDVELQFKISESRDLSVSVYISSLDLEVNELFNPHQRSVALDKLTTEIKVVLDQISHEIEEEQAEENYEYLAKLKRINDHLVVLYNESLEIKNDNSTDKKYQIDEMKRLTIQEYDDLVRHKHVLSEIQEYHDLKALFESYLQRASPKQVSEYDKIVTGEKEFLQSNNKYLIRKKTKELDNLLDNIYSKQDERFIDSFYYYRFLDEDGYKDPTKFNKLVELGEKALENQNLNELKSICAQLWELLKVKPRTREDFNNFDGDLGLK